MEMSLGTATPEDIKQRPFIVAVDFDGVIAHYDEWRGAQHIGEPLLYGKKLCEWLKTHGCYVVIFTCRTNGSWRHSGEDYWEVERIMRKWLNEHDIPYDQIAQQGQGKIYADLYIDDRAMYWPPNLGGRGIADTLEESLYRQRLDMIKEAMVRGMDHR